MNDDTPADVAALELLCDLVEGWLPVLPSKDQREVFLAAVLRARRLKAEIAAEEARSRRSHLC